MNTIVTSAPAKIILCGDHGVNRRQPALATTVDMRTLCRVSTRPDDRYIFRAGDQAEECSRRRLFSYKAEIDALREAQNLDQIRERARDFFAPTRYVLAHVVEQAGGPGLDIEWRSSVPISSGLGSGAAASTSMALAAFHLAGLQAKARVQGLPKQGLDVGQLPEVAAAGKPVLVAAQLIELQAGKGANAAEAKIVHGRQFAVERATRAGDQVERVTPPGKGLGDDAFDHVVFLLAAKHRAGMSILEVYQAAAGGQADVVPRIVGHVDEHD